MNVNKNPNLIVGVLTLLALVAMIGAYFSPDLVGIADGAQLP